MIHIILAMILYGPFGNPMRKDIQLIGYTSGKPTVIEASWIPGKDLDDNPLYLRADAAKAWRDMLTEAARYGVFLEATYAFRDHKVQKRLKKKMPRLAAPPGYSPHEAGLAVDINNCTRRVKGRKVKTDIYWWLLKHGKDFGFYQTIPNEPWHWEYVPPTESS
jgi:LAS superfamily LD-carboxypeptidase LdcB